MIKDSPKAYRALWTISFNYLLVFTAFNSALNLLSEIYDQLGYASLGKFCVFLIYLGYAFNNIAAPKIIKNLGYTKSMFYAAVSFIPSVFVGLLAISCKQFQNLPQCSSQISIVILSIIANLLAGTGLAVMWTASSGYVSGLSSPEIRGSYFGTFQSLVNGSQLAGGLMSAFLFQYINQFLYYSVLTVALGIGALLYRLQPDIPRVTAGSETSEGTKESQEDDLGWVVRKVWESAKSEKIRPLLHFAFLSGVLPAVFITFIYRLIDQSVEYETDEDLNRKTSYVLIVLGVGEIVGGVTLGYMSDIFKRTITHHKIMIFIYLAILVSLINAITSMYAFSFIAAFLWGYADCAAVAKMAIVLTRDFPGSLEVYAVYLMFQSFGTMVGAILALIFDSVPTYWFILAITVILWTNGYNTKKYYSEKSEEPNGKYDEAQEEQQV